MEKKALTLDYIKLTPALIETINHLQTGGTTSFDKPIDDKYFDNCALKDSIDEITEIVDFIIYVYSDSPELFEEKQFPKFLINLNYLKTNLKSLAAPNEK